MSLLLLIGALSNISLTAAGDVDLSFEAGSGVNDKVKGVALSTSHRALLKQTFLRGFACPIRMTD